MLWNPPLVLTREEFRSILQQEVTMIADTAHFAFSELSKSDLVVGGIYEGGQDNLVWSDQSAGFSPVAIRVEFVACG